ncbi:hypothetical protein HZH66_009898 [Vespula vulgaris]|uniref:Uncharacterized protein n=1 Tax=Vespula vulgaris TaxID=7454 RepID=A0A834JMP2_VESVU|nr:hypothetical protein HZH66_009898 [Vespula vulgaris]
MQPFALTTVKEEEEKKRKKEKRLRCEVGILSHQGQQQRRAFDRPLQFLVHLYFGLRRENLEISSGCYSDFDIALSWDFEFISANGLRNFRSFERLKIYLHEWT